MNLKIISKIVNYIKMKNNLKIINKTKPKILILIFFFVLFFFLLTNIAISEKKFSFEQAKELDRLNERRPIVNNNLFEVNNQTLKTYSNEENTANSTTTINTTNNNTSNNNNNHTSTEQQHQQQPQLLNTTKKKYLFQENTVKINFEGEGELLIDSPTGNLNINNENNNNNNNNNDNDKRAQKVQL